MDVRTDLALEVRESFPKDNVEISGVVLEEKKAGHGISVSIVDIVNENGAEAMGKPMGRYITIEASDAALNDIETGKESPGNETLKKQIVKYLSQFCKNKKKVLVACLGNRDATPDCLGPKVLDELFVTAHLINAGYISQDKVMPVCAIEPGVMAKTGIETASIIKGVINEVKPDVLIAVDALAARSITRLTKTIQITDTGICPGAGVGNNRQELSRATLGIDVVAIGVPTVVEAFTIVRDFMQKAFENMLEEDIDTEAFLSAVRNENSVSNFYVTPKSIDEDVTRIGCIIAEALNECFS